MVFIENEGAVFRGPARAWPKEVWTGEKFEPYKGDVPKPLEWGNVIDEADAQALMGASKAEAVKEPA